MNIDSKDHSLLTFRVGPVLCCAPSFPVQSIITPPRLTHPPGSHTSQPGIFKHGSHIVKVLDLRQKFGIDAADQSHPGNLIITIFEKESFAFWVDQILDVFNFPSEGWGNLPPAFPRGIFTRTLLLNKKIHLYSEFEKLATINDLGYLKHYIQHLKEQEQ
ncbi:MAG: chemotaxis protein CheW, partial [Gammaproteobacteria bacterium]|nr:chemotaxis protein CheW [Gammaproteobacteria bacterium]